MKSFITIYFFFLIFASCTIEVPPEVIAAQEELPEVIDFNYHVKPILSDRCYNCHGPDENSRKAGLRLDIESAAFSKLNSGKRAISPGSTYSSELAHRILSTDPAVIMPHPDSNLTLDSREKAMLLKWIDQGAEWKDHWSFIPPKKKDLDSEAFPGLTNPIDQFVKRKLDEKGLNFSSPASKETLIRRITFDLTGLPPSLEEINSFVENPDENAYEKLIEGLLSTDAHAERLTVDWMDLSRYADSHGLHADGARTMWPWRDWVLEAIKSNMTYDQFVTWQIAGDLLPDATTTQKLATAFNRNTPMTAEGGVVDEEWRLNYVFDRTETISTAFMGLTVACAKCHDHKFDPISQKDYYQLTSFFNNIRELGMTGDDGDYGPLLALPDPETQSKIDQINKDINSIEKNISLTKKDLETFYAYKDELPSQKSIDKKLIAHFPFEKTGKKPKIYIDGNSNIKAAAEAPEVVEGVSGNALKFKHDHDQLIIKETLIPNLEWNDAFAASIWINTSQKKPNFTQTILGSAGGKNELWRGWDLYLDQNNFLNLRLINVMPSNMIHIQSEDSIRVNEWNQITFSYDGSGKSNGVKLFKNGAEINTNSVINNLYKSIKPVSPVFQKGLVERTRPLTIGKAKEASTGDNGLFIGKMDDFRFYKDKLTALEVKMVYDNTLSKIEKPNERLIKDHWVNSDAKIKVLEKDLKTKREAFIKAYFPVLEVMVMEEMEKPRTTYLYNRGDYTSPAFPVETKVPHVLPPMKKGLPKNRLGLSQWLFDKDNPLTARVTVNRFWLMMFGQGLVSTPTDFGVQGSMPSHPQLLDWLAIDFVENKWDVRKLIKKMALSKTYQQQSISNERLTEIDPTNVYLSRANSSRLPAEMIRDNALSVSGLINNKFGGESVRPYQPSGLWREKNTFSQFLLDYKESEGEDLYRRGLYTFIRRTSPPPSMMAFDATSREVCTIKRQTTSTPLQALVLLNDPQFFEASRVFAQRILLEAGKTIEEQIDYGFRLATSRHPEKEEVEILKELYSSQLKYYKSKPSEAYKLVNVGETPYNRGLSLSKTAAMTLVANTLLNHNETYTKR